MTPLRRRRTRRIVACLCAAAVLLAALIPGAGVLDYAIPSPEWVLLAYLPAGLDALPVEVPLPREAACVIPLRGRAPPAVGFLS